MGCCEAKQSMEGKEVIFLAGYPAAGKTFMGDYLATRGWGHVDGDIANHTKDPALLAKGMKLWEGM